MLMNEVRLQTGLTRKAIEYYEDKGFIHPKREKNNYRVYSKEDVNTLKAISLYRKLGCSMDEIRQILSDSDLSPLATIIREREIKSQLENERVEILKVLLDQSTPEEIEDKLDWIEKQETIYTKLTRAFPGYFGQLYFLSYKPFFDDKLDKSNQDYYNQYIDFLDKMPHIKLDEEEMMVLERVSKDISTKDMEAANEEKIKAIDHPQDWIDDNREIIDQYLAFKETEAYKNNPIYRIQKKLQKHMEESGYYQIAIPLIRKFSPSYDAYYKKLLEADKTICDICSCRRDSIN